MLLNIEKLVYGGDGLARLPADEHGPGKTAFLPFVLQGESVEASVIEQKRGFVRAHADRILTPSAYRIEPRCPYFYACGGCQYQHASYQHQLEIKAAILKENLRRIAKLEIGTELIVHASPAWNYRNRTRLKVKTTPEFALGYYKFNSHELLSVEQCPISSALINEAIRALWSAGRAGELAGGMQEIELFANADDSQLLAECYCSEVSNEAAGEIAGHLKNVLPSAAGVTVFGSPSERTQGAEPRALATASAGNLTYTTRLAPYQVSAGAFFQVNKFLLDDLVSAVTESRSGQNALDLYAGVGLFSVVLARSFAQVTAVESSPTSFSDLKYNSPTNVKAVQATTERYLESTAGKRSHDFVVVDPPRGGLSGGVITRLGAMGAPYLTYVSCDPATLARDLSGLCASGYRIERAHMVDLFPQTYHLESVIQLAR